jgi:hypothetical protein
MIAQPLIGHAYGTRAELSRSQDSMVTTGATLR